jgi:basic membrane protein A
MQSALDKVAGANPDAKFAIVDASVTKPNVRGLKFKEEEGSFLAGYLAGLVSTSKKLGFVGGQKIPLIEKFYAGYAAGAKMANAAVEILPAKYTGDWTNVDIGKEAAKALFSGGADIVYHAAGKAGLGVINAARESGMLAIGVDSDQDMLAEGFVLTSMVKRVDEAVFQTIKDLKDGKFSAGETVYDLKSGGVGLTEMKFTKDRIGVENLAKVKEIETKIVSGEIKPPTDLASLEAFLSGLPK